jgi:alkanesulfonate monooxygenase SsuD/methylene tetrahydromethanopterin reductase-like flavin-dependent oxidoreductase (luciferase family)
MRTGVILPSFRDDAGEALAVARQAEELGVDGVFCHDHLWPMGQPERPALAPFPLLAAVATSTDRLMLGTLVARIGLVPDEVLMAEFAALSALAPGRVVAGLGVGDHLSAAENQAYGVPFAPVRERQASLRRCARALRELGVPVWVGGGSASTVEVAYEEGAAVNLWGQGPEQVAEQARRSEVTWAGPPAPSSAVPQLLAELDRAGASWAVMTWPVPLAVLAEHRSPVAGDTGS